MSNITATVSKVQLGAMSPALAGSKVQLGAMSPALGGSKVQLGAMSPVLGGSKVQLGAMSPVLGGSKVQLGAMSPALGNAAKRDVAEKGSVLADLTTLDQQLAAVKNQLTDLRARLEKDP